MGIFTVASATMQLHRRNVHFGFFCCTVFILSIALWPAISVDKSTFSGLVSSAVAAPAATPSTQASAPAFGLETTQPVLTGIDVLLEDKLAKLNGKRIGLVTNQTGITRDGKSTVDVLAGVPNIRLVALYAPEHGVSGKIAAGRIVKNGRESKHRIPVYSLYGRSRKPTAAMLRGIDALVFDLQDIGSRSYTYISTMGECMAACAAQKKEFVVLDRPNLIGGGATEGNLTEQKFRSFIGAYPISYRHGLTVGELARLINGEKWLPGRRQCKLTVIPLRNYRRDIEAHQTGLPWRRTSPNIPYQHTPFFYAATGILGELSAFSIGIGTRYPFELVGAPDISGVLLARELNRRRLPGFAFRTWSWKPTKGAFAGRTCQGVRVEITDKKKVQLTRLNFEIIDVARRIAPRKRIFGVSRSKDKMFDLACGTNRVRSMLAAGKSAREVWNFWNADAAKFKVRSRKYLLYS